MENKLVMVPVEEVDLSAVKYKPKVVRAPHLTGFALKLFTIMIEAPLIGSLITYYLKRQKKQIELLRNTKIPEPPMFKPEFSPQEPEHGVIVVDEGGKPEDRVQSLLQVLPDYDPANWSDGDSASSFKYWKIRDCAHAYCSKLVTPSMVSENIISVMEEFAKMKPHAPLLITFDAEEVRKQAAASTQRFKEGNPISILDGIFIAIKDDIDCCPYPTKGATIWMREVRSVKRDAISVSRLRSCGVIFVGKANMHELGMGTTGINPNYGTTRNPHAEERYTGGSSSGPAAIVASGICPAALGTDGGGSIRIPSSLCVVVGLKTTYGRTDTKGSLVDGGTVAVIGSIASSVEDVMLVYAAILGSSPADRISWRQCPPCFPNLSSPENTDALRSLQLGKYTPWFNDVNSTDISNTCDNILSLLSETHGCQVVMPELQEMLVAHLVTIGSEALSFLSPDIENRKGPRLTCDVRINFALFRSFRASDYVAAQRLRRRIMYHHMEIFKRVDVIVTPTTGITAPVISPSALKYGETSKKFSANLPGLPAISVPVGYDKQGLPIGLQLIGRPWGEATILRLASAVEELSATSRKRPASFYDFFEEKNIVNCNNYSL